jgi:divalent metal cation (Fe/Co/Zn/Cd) transporter
MSGQAWIDPVIAGLVALNILREGWLLMRRSVDGLMDHALADEDIARIEAVLARFREQGVEFDELRTRRAGALQFAHVVIRLPGEWTVTRAHDVADAVERQVEDRTGTQLSTHLEPQTGRD